MPAILEFPIAGLPIGLLLFAALCVFASGVIRGYTGFGFAIAAVPLLSLVMPPVDAVPLVLLLNMGAGLLQLRKLWGLAHWSSVRWLLLGMLIGMPLGLYGLATIPADPMRLAIALAVLAAVVLIGGGFRFQVMPGRVTSVAVGALSGVLNGGAAMPGPPVILFYLSGPTAVSVGRASLVMFFFFNAIAGAASAAVGGLLSLHTVLVAALLMPALVLGTRLGDKRYDAAPPEAYRKVALGALLAVALLALARSVGGLLG